MENLKKHIADLEGAIDRLDDIDEAGKIEDALFKIANDLRRFRSCIPDWMDKDTACALDFDLEDLEVGASDALKRVEANIKHTKECLAEEAIYGSYEDQKRDQYYGSCL